MATTYQKRLRNWFFTTIGDTQRNGFWTRFTGVGISKPSEETMSDLVASAAFHTEISSAAQIDTVAALQDKQGLVIIASDANAKSGTNTPLGFTSGRTTVQPSQLPTVESTTNDFTVTTLPTDGANTATQDPFDLVADATTTRNRYILKFKTAFVKWILRRVVPAGGTIGQALIKLSGVDYDYAWGTVAAGSTGDIFKTTSTTSIDPSVVALGSNAVFTVPTGLAYTVGQTVRVYSTGTPTKQLFGTVVSFTGTTLTLKKVYSNGSGASTDWQINLSPTEFPDYTGITAKSNLIATNGVMSWELSAVVTNANQFWISPNGNDTTGDGSINKPWATFSKARTEIINVANTTGVSITLMVIGGTYTNSTNMAISKTSTAYYNYTINCFPGVTINQSVAPFYDNNIINGHIDVYGSPSITVASIDSFVGYVIRIATKRNGATQTIQTHQYGKIICGGTTQALYSGSAVNGTNGVAFAYIKALQLFSAASPVVTFEGEDGIIGFSCALLSSGTSGAIGVLINAPGSVTIIDTKSGPQVQGQNFTDYKIQAGAAFNATWLTGTGKGQKGGIYLKDCISYSMSGSSASHTFLDIRGAGNLSTTSLIENCKSMNFTAATLGSFILATSSSDTINVVNCLEANSASVTIGSPTINAVGTSPTIASANIPFFISPIQ